MSRIILSGGEKNVTTISNAFLDKYMIKANGEYVKVYLYLLRCLEDSSIELTIGYLAEKLEHTEKDIIRAVKYWAEQGVLQAEFKGRDIESIRICDLSGNKESLNVKPVEKIDESKPENKIAEEAPDTKPKNTRKMTMDKRGELMADEEFKMFLYVIQTYMEKTLSAAELDKILYIYSELAFSTELIEYLVEYCVSNNHKSMKYIETVALNWKEQGITSVEEAKDYISANNFYPVLKAFGLSGRNPVMVEKAFIMKWKDEYGFDMDIIVNACNRTMEAIHEPSFKYADSILQRWMKKGVKTVDDLKAIDDEHEKNKEISAQKTVKKTTVTKNAFTNFNQRTYDYDAIERMLLQKQ